MNENDEKKNREINNKEIYSYMHDVFGMEVLNIFDMFTQNKDKWAISDNDIKLAQKYAKTNACMASAINSGFLYVDDFENIHLNSNPTQRGQAIKNLDKTSQLYCIPDDAVLGVINFGSPYIVFYSDVFDENSLNIWLKKLDIIVVAVYFCDQPNVISTFVNG